MEFAVLGPLEVRRGATRVKIGSRKQRALLIHLLLQLGQTVPADRLIDALWDDEPPPQARITLRSYISHLRRVLHTKDADDLIVTRSNGYSLEVDPQAVDSVRFERAVAAARARLKSNEPEPALNLLDDALQLWRGQALADLGEDEAGSGDRIRLEELRLSAHEDRYDALLALGRHGEAVPALEAFTAAEPLRERARSQLMLALYRSGRAPDSLQVFQRFRETLVEELGLDPSPQLQLLADQILNQASELDAPTPAPPAVVAQARVPAAATSTPLVGRVHERAELQAGLSGLTNHEGALLLFAGEPGIGKTALLEELARMAAAIEVSVYWGRCHDGPGAPAFWPWVQILRAMAHDRDDRELQELVSGDAAAVAILAEEFSRRTGIQPPAVGDDMEGARFQLYDAIATFLLRAAEQRPLVLLLDDLHWADTATLQALAFITPMLGSHRVLVAGSYRDIRADYGPELEETLATVIREPVTRQLGLAGLQPADVAQLAERLTGERSVAEKGEMLHQRTGGNPFFVRQLSQLLDASAPDAMADAAIPTGVRHVLAQRLRMVPPNVRDMLDAASVFGRMFDAKHLAEATGTPLDEVLDAVVHGTAQGLLEAAEGSTTTARFVHALVRETIYDNIPAHRRARLHADIANVLEGQPQTRVEELADHFWHAADVVDADRPVRYLVAAADEALGVLGYEQAEDHLHRALTLLTQRRGDSTDELKVRARLVQLVINTRGWTSSAIEEIAGSIPDLIARAGLRPEIVALWSSLLGYYMARGDVDAASGVAEDMLEAANSAGDPGLLAAAHSAVAYIDISLGRDPANALEHIARARQHLSAAPPEQLRAPPYVGVQIANFEAIALAMSGDGAAAKAVMQRALTDAEEVGDPFRQVHALTNAGLVGIVLEDAAYAGRAATAALSVCREKGFRTAAQEVVAIDSWARARLGEDPAEHAERMWETFQAAGAAGHHGPRASYLLFTAETFLLAGDATGALRCLDESRVHAARLGEQLPAERLARVEAGIRELTDSG